MEQLPRRREVGSIIVARPFTGHFASRTRTGRETTHTHTHTHTHDTLFRVSETSKR
jgi:hypothetical protein